MKWSVCCAPEQKKRSELKSRNAPQDARVLLFRRTHTFAIAPRGKTRTPSPVAVARNTRKHTNTHQASTHPLSG